MFRLTPRETEALHLCRKGLSAKQIAAEMGISVHTAKSFLRTISIKMGASSRAEIMAKLLGHMCDVSLNCPFNTNLPAGSRWNRMRLNKPWAWPGPDH